MLQNFTIPDQKIEEILIKGNYISKEDLEPARKYAKSRDTSVVEYFLVNDFINKDLLGQAIAEHYELAYADINSNPPSRDEVLRIPEEIAKKNRIIFFMEDQDGIVISTDNPENEAWFDEVRKLFPKRDIFVAYSLPEDIDSMMIYYRKSLKTRFAQIIEESERVIPEIIDEIFDDALIYNASDIHFEPKRKEVLVRFRIDGILHEAGRIPKKYYLNILNRVKVQAHLQIDDHFSAQDSSIRYNKNGQQVDLRISILPTLDGEKIVVRVLSSYMRGFSLNDIGLRAEDQRIIEEASRKPFGMMLNTGPTGSGKTTTLYSILKVLDNPEINITTIEDPVEYRIKSINQIQVNTKTGLTFSRGLRSIVRQDPDVILVGEIRDTETAEIAVNAALTGHLLLSTFHANDAATAIPRLLDMGVEPFLLASTLEIIVAQRLARRICENCRTSYTENTETLEKSIPNAKYYFKNDVVTLYKGKGCKACSETGFKGRIAIFEIIKVTQEIQDLILEDPSSHRIWKIARQQGSKTLFEDGVKKVLTGITEINELLRVASPPEFEQEKYGKPEYKPTKKSGKKPKAKSRTKGRGNKSAAKKSPVKRSKKGQKKN
ncbi:MAG: hypothetical protein GF347_03875 [Candidatus Moranbacteria bacterium]|nr:hypothetical protein [Candidatus Moranbacteria bacterium]